PFARGRGELRARRRDRVSSVAGRPGPSDERIFGQMFINILERSISVGLRIFQRLAQLFRRAALKYLISRSEPPVRRSRRLVRPRSILSLVTARARHADLGEAPLHVHAVKLRRISEQRAIAVGVTISTARMLEDARDELERCARRGG